MLHILKRHPVPIAARFEHAISLTYAFPRERLTPLVSPGLELDVLDEFGFLSVVTAQTTNLRPAFLPGNFGRNYFLISYRLFTRFKINRGETLRGLQTLRSDTDSSWLVKWGNRMTGYAYRKAEIECGRPDGMLQLDVKTPDGVADLNLTADISHRTESLPAGSPFPNFESAIRFVGPLPYTFNYEPETQSMIIVEGRRQNWSPLSVDAEVHQSNFLQVPPFRSPVLAGVFYLTDVPYRWNRGWREPLSIRNP